MATDNKWIKAQTTGYDTSMNGKVVMTPTQVNTLWKWVMENPISSAIFGDYTKWCSSLMFFPFNISPDVTANYKLSVMGVQSDEITCKGLIPSNAIFGYTLGEYLYPLPTKYLDYEPYTKLEVYLPFYGLINLKISDVAGKYIQFRLFVDYNSGVAQYVVGVNEASVSSPNAPYWINTDDTNTRIIGTYVFNLGYNIPITSTGMAETIRNISLAVIKGTGNIASSYIVDKLTPNTTTNASTTTFTRRNPKTGRQVTMGTKQEVETRERYDYGTNQRVGTAFNTATSVLEGLSLSPVVDKANNNIINSSTCMSVVIIKKQVVPTIDITSSEYRKLYGLPLGEFKLLSTITGYTEISSIHLEGEGFNEATHRELAMISELLNGGIIL